MTVDPERLLQPDYLEGLTSRSMAEVRAMREACVDVETGLSFLRRMVQGHLDIVRRELEHRGAGAEHLPVVDELREVLADGPRGAGVGRLPRTLEPRIIDPAFAAELDELTSGLAGDLARVDDEALRAVEDRLADLERRLSDRRRAFFTQIDALQAELTRRYRDGEATVDALLEER